MFSCILIICRILLTYICFAEEMMNNLKRISCAALVFSLLLPIASCNNRTPLESTTHPSYFSLTNEAEEASDISGITNGTVRLVGLSISANPATSPDAIPDPAADINKELIDIYRPTEQDLLLYNDVYHAVVECRESVDLSAYDLPFAEKIMVCELLSGEKSFHLPYLESIEYDEERDMVSFTYLTDDRAQIARDRETLSARIGQLLYNVAPGDASDLVRFAAVFEYMCETADFAPGMAGTLMAGPDGILLRHGGICYGFTDLLNYALPRIGIETNYVQNKSHAWNQVVIDGNLYHTDLSFAVGSFGTVANSFDTFLMNDERRIKTLSAAGIPSTDILLGYESEAQEAPPPCTEDSFSSYEVINESYAVDIGNSRIFFCDGDGIKSMDLDTSDPVALAEENAISMVCFDDILYFLSADDGGLYYLIAGEEPMPLDVEETYNTLYLDNATLVYGTSLDRVKKLRLLPGVAEIESWGTTQEFAAQTADRSLTYSFVAEFSAPMDTTGDFDTYVILTNDKGDPLAARLTWNEDGTVLTIRPKYSIDEYKSLRLYVLAGTPAKDGGALENTEYLSVLIHSVADALIAGS